MAFADDRPQVAEGFDELRRFHVYDHSHDRWVMSGVDFGDCVALQHVYDQEDSDGPQAHVFSTIDTITAEDDDLTVVYEDGGSEEYTETTIDMDVAADAADAVTDAVAELEGVDPERIRVASLSAPNVVAYFVAPEAVGE